MMVYFIPQIIGDRSWFWFTRLKIPTRPLPRRWSSWLNITAVDAVQPFRMMNVSWCIYSTWWLIPLSKWVITPVINGISRVNPLITGVITHLLSGMSHQVSMLTSNLCTKPALFLPAHWTRETIWNVAADPRCRLGIGWKSQDGSPQKRTIPSFKGEHDDMYLTISSLYSYVVNL